MAVLSANQVASCDSPIYTAKKDLQNKVCGVD